MCLKSSIQQRWLFYRGIVWSCGKELFLAPFRAAWKVPSVESPSPKLDRLWMCRIMRGRDRLALWPRNTHWILYYISLLHTHTFFSLKITTNCTTAHERPRKRKIKSSIWEAVDTRRHSYILTYIPNMSATALTGSMWRQYDRRHHRKQPCRGSEWFCRGSNSMNIVWSEVEMRWRGWAS